MSTLPFEKKLLQVLDAVRLAEAEHQIAIQADKDASTARALAATEMDRAHTAVQDARRKLHTLIESYINKGE